MRSGKTIRVGDRVHLKETDNHACGNNCTLIVVAEPSDGMVACRRECSPCVEWYSISNLLVGASCQEENDGE